MANPNMLTITTVTGKTDPVTLANTGTFSIANNAAASGQIWKLNTVLFVNYGSEAANVALNLYPSAALAGTPTPLANNLTIPVGASLVAIDKSSSLYLLEDKSIGASASTGNTVSVFVSYEVLS